MKAGPISRWALRALTRPAYRNPHTTLGPWDPEALGALLRPADVLLVEGDQRISRAIGYLTTSPWSHSALYLGDFATAECVSDACRRSGDGARHILVEALAEEGVVCTPLAKYRTFRVRICRPRDLTPADARAVCAHAASQIGKTYDVDNIVDLARYFLPAGFVPARLRLDALHFGAGKPTEVICSSLIAAAFASVGYPIHPLDARRERRSLKSRMLRALLGPAAPRLERRPAPATLAVPRDFDLSPYFDVVKPPAPEVTGYRKLFREADADDAIG